MHNRRTAEYLAHIGRDKFYVRTDLMAANETWVASDFGGTSLSERYNQIAAMVKEKTGRAMQTKDRERVNKKTGKVTVVRGSTPLKEGVVVIKDDTTLEQLQHFCEVCRSGGVSRPCKSSSTVMRALQHPRRYRHMEAKPSCPYRMGLDEPRHREILQAGREKPPSDMQTLLAECLDMERGQLKGASGKGAS